MVHMAVWVVFFSIMTMIGKTDGQHRGDTVPFWEQACAEGRSNACERLLKIEASYCSDVSAWACNELGRYYTEGMITLPDAGLAREYFSRSCELRFPAACLNLLEPGSTRRSNPKLLDLRLLLREGGHNLIDMPKAELYARACDHKWVFACIQGAR